MRFLVLIIHFHTNTSNLSHFYSASCTCYCIFCISSNNITHFTSFVLSLAAYLYQLIFPVLVRLFILLAIIIRVLIKSELYQVFISQDIRWKSFQMHELIVMCYVAHIKHNTHTN